MDLDQLIKEAIAEDLGDGDHTSEATIPGDAVGQAKLLVKEEGIIAGIGVAEKVFKAVDRQIRFTAYLKDGDRVSKGDVVFLVSGKVRSILGGERLALNFMQRMSGIATATRIMTENLQGTKARILDTRKTTPLMRELEKRAVRTGGGFNHRLGLYDMILIKDNHIDFAGGIKKAIGKTRNYLASSDKDLMIEIEVRNFDELRQVLDAGGIQRIMLDNFKPDELREAVEIIGGRYETEASGGINLENIREYALTGVDFISVGALTHHVRSLDLSLKAVK